MSSFVPEELAPSRTAILVLGMHRSGTSALTRVLNIMGIDLGPRLMDPGPDNATGFWEHKDVVLLHDRLLNELGSSWDDPSPISWDLLIGEESRSYREELVSILRRDFDQSPVWGLKDPRLCRLVPLWLSALAEVGCAPRFVLVCRDPREVAASLEKRNGFHAAKSDLLWLSHCLAAERETRGQPRSFVTYDQIVSDWRSTVRAIAAELDFNWEERIEHGGADVDAFLDPRLRHHRVADDEAEPLHRWLQVTYDAYKQAATEDSGEIERLLDVMRKRSSVAIEMFLPWIGSMRDDQETMRALLKDRDAKIARLRGQVMKLRNELADRPAIAPPSPVPAPPPAQAPPAPTPPMAQAPPAPPTPPAPPAPPPPVAPLPVAPSPPETAAGLPQVEPLAPLPPPPSPPARESHPVIEAFSEASRSATEEDTEAPEVETYETAEGSPRVSIIIPLFNKVALTVQCLESIVDHTPRGLFEVILVDNGSTDGTQDFLRCLEGNVTILTNRKNLGFSNACNQGAAAASTDRLLFLNNDVVAREGWLEPLLDLLDRDDSVGAVGSKLLFPDGTIQHAGVALLSNPEAPNPLVGFHVFYGESADHAAANELAEFQVLTAACLLVRRDVFERVQGFDAFYWNGCEDIDLCLKIGVEGWKLVYQPASVLVHHESQSGPERYSRVHGNEKLLSSRWYGKAEADIEVLPDGSRRRTEAGRIRPYRSPTAQERENDVASVAIGAPELLTSIIVLTRNQLEHTRLCFESIRQRTPEPHEIIFVDNGSDDGTLEFLRDVVRGYDHARVVAKSKNLGFAGGNNQGLAAARGSHYVLLNNDTIVTDGWLGGMLAVLDEHPDVGLVGPMTNYASGPQVVSSVGYSSIEQMHRFAREWALEHTGRSEPARRLVGFCLLVRGDVVKRIGGLDERFGLGNCEDDDFCLRAFQAGYRAAIAQEVFVHHTGSRTFAGENIDYAESMARAFEIFKAKWGLPAETRAENGYPFMELASGPPQPMVPLPDLASRHMPEMAGRWLADKALSRSGAPRASDFRLRVGVLDGEEIHPNLRSLFAQFGHEGDIPIWRNSAELAFQLRSPGLVLLLGPDVILSPEVLQELVAVMASDASIAAVGPTSNAAPEPQRVKPDYKNLKRSLGKFAAKRLRRHRSDWNEVPYLGGFCLLLRAEAAVQAGGLAEDRSLADALFDLYERLGRSGFHVACARGAYVHHSHLDENEGYGYDGRPRAAHWPRAEAAHPPRPGSAPRPGVQRSDPA